MFNIISTPSMINARKKGYINSSQHDYANAINNSTLFSIISRVICLSSRRFKWENLPEGVPDWFIETSLFWHDMIGGANDEIYGGIILPAYSADAVNRYGIPISYNFIGVNYNNKFNYEDCCILRDEFLGSNLYLVLEPLIYNLYESMRARDMNIQNNKIPIIYSTNKKQELTAKTILNKIFNNEFAIFKNDSLAGVDEMIKTQSAIPPYLIDKLDTHINQIWNEIYTILGIQTQSIQKAERVQAAEVYASVEQNKMYKQSAIDCRKRWCDECNSKLGWNISVEWSIPEITGGEINGELYNNIKGNADANTVI